MAHKGFQEGDEKHHDIADIVSVKLEKMIEKFGMMSVSLNGLQNSFSLLDRMAGRMTAQMLLMTGLRPSIPYGITHALAEPGSRPLGGTGGSSGSYANEVEQGVNDAIGSVFDTVVAQKLQRLIDTISAKALTQEQKQHAQREAAAQKADRLKADVVEENTSTPNAAQRFATASGRPAGGTPGPSTAAGPTTSPMHDAHVKAREEYIERINRTPEGAKPTGSVPPRTEENEDAKKAGDIHLKAAKTQELVAKKNERWFRFLGDHGRFGDKHPWVESHASIQHQIGTPTLALTAGIAGMARASSMGMFDTVQKSFHYFFGALGQTLVKPLANLTKGTQDATEWVRKQDPEVKDKVGKGLMTAAVAGVSILAISAIGSKFVKAVDLLKPAVEKLPRVVAGLDGALVKSEAFVGKVFTGAKGLFSVSALSAVAATKYRAASGFTVGATSAAAGGLAKKLTGSSIARGIAGGFGGGALASGIATNVLGFEKGGIADNVANLGGGIAGAFALPAMLKSASKLLKFSGYGLAASAGVSILDIASPDDSWLGKHGKRFSRNWAKAMKGDYEEGDSYLARRGRDITWLGTNVMDRLNPFSPSTQERKETQNKARNLETLTATGMFDNIGVYARPIKEYNGQKWTYDDLNVQEKAAYFKERFPGVPLFDRETEKKYLFGPKNPTTGKYDNPPVLFWGTSVKEGSMDPARRNKDKQYLMDFATGIKPEYLAIDDVYKQVQLTLLGDSPLDQAIREQDAETFLKFAEEINKGMTPLFESLEGAIKTLTFVGGGG